MRCVGSRLRREGLECWLRTRRRNALTREERKMGARRWRAAARGQVSAPLRRSCLASRGLPVVRLLGSRRRREFRGGGRHGGGIPVPGVQGVSTSVSLPAMQGAGVRELGTSQGPVTSDVRRKSNELRCGVSGRPGRPLELHPKLMRRRRTVGEFRKTRHPRNVEFNEVLKACFSGAGNSRFSGVWDLRSLEFANVQSSGILIR
jgi:hypothetical protein